LLFGLSFLTMREHELFDMIRHPGTILDGVVERRQPYAPSGCVRSSRLAAASILGSRACDPSKKTPPSTTRSGKTQRRGRKRRLSRTTVTRRLRQFEAYALKTLQLVQTFRREADIDDEPNNENPEREDGGLYVGGKRRRRGCRAGTAVRAKQHEEREGGATFVAETETRAVAGVGVDRGEGEESGADLIFSSCATGSRSAVGDTQKGAQAATESPDLRCSQVAAVAVTWSNYRHMEAELRAVQERVMQMQAEADKERAENAEELKRAAAKQQGAQARAELAGQVQQDRIRQLEAMLENACGSSQREIERERKAEREAGGELREQLRQVRLELKEEAGESRWLAARVRQLEVELQDAHLVQGLLAEEHECNFEAEERVARLQAGVRQLEEITGQNVTVGGTVEGAAEERKIDVVVPVREREERKRSTHRRWQKDVG